MTPTVPTPAVADPDARPGFHVRIFGSREFFRLWLTQVVSATGDWLGFLAIAALATRVGAGSAEAAVGVVMAARIVPGFFLGPASGVIADRFDRKKVMVVCDIGRAAVLACLPFVDNVLGLVVASLVLEVFTLLWTPAKEASVPNLVPTEHLTTANSLSLVAAYGTLPVAAGLFSLLSKVAEWVGGIDAIERAAHRPGDASPSSSTRPRSCSRRSWCLALTPSADERRRAGSAAGGHGAASTSARPSRSSRRAGSSSS